MLANKRYVLGILSVSVVLSAQGCGVTDKESVAYKQDLFRNCAQCHGNAGEGDSAAALDGNPAFSAPAIAGMEPWYIKAQLRKFTRGVRGTNTEDHAGKRMRPMALDLGTDERLQLVAAYVASMEPQRPTPILEGGDPARGQGLYATCAACHGQKAEGKLELRAPRLAGMNDWYLVEQLKKFKSGVRGTHPNDITGAQMRPMSMLLADEQAMKDVVAHIMTLSE